jgi:hypothetical protein
MPDQGYIEAMFKSILKTTVADAGDAARARPRTARQARALR